MKKTRNPIVLILLILGGEAIAVDFMTAEIYHSNNTGQRLKFDLYIKTELSSQGYTIFNQDYTIGSGTIKTNLPKCNNKVINMKSPLAAGWLYVKVRVPNYFNNSKKTCGFFVVPKFYRPDGSFWGNGAPYVIQATFVKTKPGQPLKYNLKIVKNLPRSCSTWDNPYPPGC